MPELCLNVHSETHRFALGSHILINCLLLDVIHKYRYSNYLDYNAYHTWLHSPFPWAYSSHPRGNKTIKIHHGTLIRVASTFLKSMFSILFAVRTEESPGATQYPCTTGRCCGSAEDRSAEAREQCAERVSDQRKLLWLICPIRSAARIRLTYVIINEWMIMLVF